MSPINEKTPATAPTATGASEKLGKGISANNHTATEPRKERRRRLALHAIVREEPDYRIALCGHRIPRKYAIELAPTTRYADGVEYYPCSRCEALKNLEHEMRESRVELRALLEFLRGSSDVCD